MLNFKHLGALSALALAAVTPAAHAFEMKVHLAITDEALRRSGYGADAGALIKKGNELTDQDEFTDPAAHFDSETFEGGSARLRRKLANALDKISQCKRATALDEIGRSLHAIQDFYSHSNYIDIVAGSKEPIDLLNLKNPDKNAFCDPKTFQGPLTSGYFPDDKTPKGKCSHDQLNKDSPGTVRGTMRHAMAVAFATSASVQFLQLVDARLKEATGTGPANALLVFLKSDPSPTGTIRCIASQPKPSNGPKSGGSAIAGDVGGSSYKATAEFRPVNTYDPLRWDPLLPTLQYTR